MKFSINPLNNKKYLIPSELDDKKNIDLFIKRNKNKKIVVVQGLGFVGAAMSVVCANSDNEEYAVLGVDLPNTNSYWKIASMNEGLLPINSTDKKLERKYHNAIDNFNLFATYDFYAYSKADIIIIDINLDVEKINDSFGSLVEYDIDLNAFKKAIYSVGENCKQDCLIIIETTVPPGTTENIVKPIIESCFRSRKINLNKIMIGHSYERVMPGPDYYDSIKNFYRVYSGVDDKSSNAIKNFLLTIISTKKFPLTKLNNTTSTEMAKVLENSYRAMNIAFIVEWTRFAENANVNIYDIINSIKMRPTHNNMMFPGIGVGGYCLTKDPLMGSWANENFYNSNYILNQSIEAVRINDKMPYSAFKFLKSELKKLNHTGKNISILGVSYRSDIGDTRYSPSNLFYDLLVDNGYNIKVHDPFISLWEEKRLNINNDLKDVLTNDTDIIIICTSHTFYKSIDLKIDEFNLKNKLIFDLVGILSQTQIDRLYDNNIVRVIGRGDL